MNKIPQEEKCYILDENNKTISCSFEDRVQWQQNNPDREIIAKNGLLETRLTKFGFRTYFGGESPIRSYKTFEEAQAGHEIERVFRNL